MIWLTKLSGTKFLINLDTVKYIESVPDTVVTFMNGDTIVVCDTLEDIVEKSKSYDVNIIKNSLVKLVPEYSPENQEIEKLNFIKTKNKNL